MTEISLRSVATVLLQSALRIAPQHAAEWGRAMLGELQHVEGDWAAFAWAAGGAGVLAKHALLSLVIPGQTDEIVPIVAKENPMRKSTLIAAAACLAACLLFFAVPSFREGLSLVLSSWHYTWQSAPGSEIVRWTELGRKAESRGDTATMAYAAMELSTPEGDRMAERAIARDPSLTWINYFTAIVGDRDRRTKLLSALSKWDPDNAVPYLFIATYDPKWPETME